MSKTPVKLHQKYRLKCIKNTEFIVSKKNLLLSIDSTYSHNIYTSETLLSRKFLDISSKNKYRSK